MYAYAIGERMINLDSSESHTT